MKFCVLGTKAGGAPLTNKHSAATALMLGSEVILFDCAEGTQIQLLHAKISRGHLNHIFISHLHGDHILGLPTLLTTMGADRRTTPLHIYAPTGLKEYLDLGLTIMDAVPSFEIIYHELGHGMKGELLSTNSFRVSTQMLEHRIDSFGFRVEELPHTNISIEKAHALGVTDGAMIGRIKREGTVILPNDGRTVHFADIAAPQHKPRSFVYAGDTCKCAATIELAHRASVLVHEATFRADMNDKATERFHSTSEQAAEVALEAGVERLFLSHISVRYKSGLPLLREARKIFPQTFLAKELLIENVP
ncbi:MAG: ribonuclease Z [Candidatus Kapabacteria bacterium]|nr:ribonuclease Z [Candidatus Kapabacteria bacterium]